MGFLNEAGLGVNNHYGTREREGVGHLKTDGIKRELAIDLYKALVDGDIERDVVTIPAGSLILNAYLDVSDAFTMTGTTPTILVGTDGTEATNGLVISAAVAAATGAADVSSTLTGTWAAKLAAETTIGLSKGGTTPVITVDGAARLVIEYIAS